MKGIKMPQVPWAIMVSQNDCEHCDRLPICTYRDLLKCFESNIDHVVEMTKKEAEELTKN